MKYSESNQSHYHFVYPKSHMDCCHIETSSRNEVSVTNRLNMTGPFHATVNHLLALSKSRE